MLPIVLKILLINISNYKVSKSLPINIVLGVKVN